MGRGVLDTAWRCLIAGVVTIAAACIPATSAAQHLRRTDVIAQDDLGSHGLASDSLCGAAASSTTPGAYDPPPVLSGASSRWLHVAGSAMALVEGHQTSAMPRRTRGAALGQLRAHVATRCRFDGALRVLAGPGNAAGADVVTVMHWTAALGGALHAFLELSAARNSDAADRLAVPRGAELGAAYTTFNLLELVPVFHAPGPEHRARLDLRARLSAAALLEYAGDARRLHGKSILPEYSATTALVVHEKFNVALLYTVRVIPAYLAPHATRPGNGLTLWEQTVVLDHEVLLSNTGSAWARLEPFVGIQYSRRELRELDLHDELALHAGLHLY